MAKSRYGKKTNKYDTNYDIIIVLKQSETIIELSSGTEDAFRTASANSVQPDLRCM